MTIRLKPELEALIQKDVERGPYQSAGEFVELAVQMLHEQEQWLADNAPISPPGSKKGSLRPNVESFLIPSKCARSSISVSRLGKTKISDDELPVYAGSSR